MQKNSFLTSPGFGHYKLSSSYPTIKPFFTKDLPFEGLLNFNSCNSFTRSWGSSHSTKSNDFLRSIDTPNNSDLQPLTWLQKQSIINIIPLDTEEEMHNDLFTPGHDAVLDPHLCCPREEVETQENSNIQDYVRFQAQRSNISHQRLALRQHNSFCPDSTHNYSYKVNGHTKPNLSYTQLIFMAIETCKDRAMTVNDIYQWCEVNYPYYKHIGPSWKNSLRHNLSINKSFRRMPRDGQMVLGKCELLTNDDLAIEDSVSQRDNKQGGPGRGAYWVVDDKERKNLLESIYRAQQTVPLGDRNEQLIDPPFSLVVNPPKSGPLLCIDGRFTDATTYLQSRRSDDEVIIDAKPNIITSPTSESAPFFTEGNPETEYVAMMRGLTSSVNPEATDVSVKLSLSCNSQFSKPENHDSTDSSKPKVKNRRKSSHEKVRSYLDTESSCKEDDTATSPTNNKESNPNHNMTSVNVVVAPHFDHIYARYQQFLPPAIASDMEKTAFAQQQDHDSNPDAEFLKNGYRDEEEESEEEDNFSNVVKTEKTEVDILQDKPSNLNVKRFSTKFNTSKVAFTTRRKLKRPITKVLQSKVKRSRISSVTVEVKQEMVEPTDPATKDSDGYNTDSTMPMTARNLRRSSRVHMKRRFNSKRNSKFPMNSVFNSDRLYRSKRKRSRPLRIEESHELSAIRFLANLERRHQQYRNINNLYNLNNFLAVSESSVKKGLPPAACDLIDLSSLP